MDRGNVISTPPLKYFIDIGPDKI
uniref:Uncharacterized protein n=1 Tax=Anguilla anguilla TaxID=7936 RepID=A0A0E9PIM8_ANGAN